MQTTSTKNSILEQLKKTNWKAIVFFTSFTFLLWLILQFSKTHTVTYKIDVEFEDIPVKEILQVEHIQLSASIKQTGFNLFKKQFTNSAISISMAEVPKNDSVYVFRSSVFAAQIANQLQISTEDLLIKNEEVAIPFSNKSTKKVPIRFNVEVSYATSFASYRGIQFDMDSIQIAGAEDVLSSIDEVETERLQLQKLKNNTSGKLILVNPFSDAVAFENLFVNYNLQVEKFSEQKFSVPVQLINTPDEFMVDLIPDEVVVKFQSSLTAMDEIEVEDFEVICDYKSALQQAYILVPKLNKKPKTAIRIQIEPNRIEYILRPYTK